MSTVLSPKDPDAEHTWFIDRRGPSLVSQAEATTPAVASGGRNRVWSEGRESKSRVPGPLLDGPGECWRQAGACLKLCGR
eukprot:COSAG02_NODE_26449_length_632_cov_3.827392_1_plen_80_part_00